MNTTYSNNNTKTKHTDLSCHTGSCMAHLNYFPPGVAGVNFCSFIAVPSGGGCWHYAKCAMVLSKIDSKINEHAKLWILQEIAKWLR